MNNDRKNQRKVEANDQKSISLIPSHVHRGIGR